MYVQNFSVYDDIPIIFLHHKGRGMEGVGFRVKSFMKSINGGEKTHFLYDNLGLKR